MTNQNMMPVDLLFTEYFSAVNSQGKRQFGDPRRNVNPFRVLQYNMLEHLGKQSTFSGRGQRHVGNCGSKLKVNSWMKQETFQQKCAMAGMSPCEAGVGTFGALVQYGYHRGTQRSLPGHIEILVGTKGLSCDEVCSNTDKSKCASCFNQVSRFSSRPRRFPGRLHLEPRLQPTLSRPASDDSARDQERLRQRDKK